MSGKSAKELRKLEKKLADLQKTVDHLRADRPREDWPARCESKFHTIKKTAVECFALISLVTTGVKIAAEEIKALLPQNQKQEEQQQQQRRNSVTKERRREIFEDPPDINTVRVLEILERRRFILGQLARTQTADDLSQLLVSYKDFTLKMPHEWHGSTISLPAPSVKVIPFEFEGSQALRIDLTVDPSLLPEGRRHPNPMTKRALLRGAIESPQSAPSDKGTSDTDTTDER